MIHPSELRIGNKFSKFNQETGTWQLITIGVKDIECAVNFPKVFAAFYEPIKLTPYYLEKLGFESRSGVSEMDNGRSHSYVWASLKIPGNQFEIKYEYQSPCENKAYHQGHERFSITAGFGEWNSGEVELKHLHNLQNIYRDLSGTELDVPEKL